MLNVLGLNLDIYFAWKPNLNREEMDRGGHQFGI